MNFWGALVLAIMMSSGQCLVKHQPCMFTLTTLSWLWNVMKPNPRDRPCSFCTEGEGCINDRAARTSTPGECYLGDERVRNGPEPLEVRFELICQKQRTEVARLSAPKTRTLHTRTNRQ